MSRTLKVPPQVKVVVDLTVEHHPERAILVAHWLRPALQVDDAQATVAQGTGPAEQESQTGVIGPAVRERVPEAQCDALDVDGRIIREDA
jgi:hypothetical protein